MKIYYILLLLSFLLMPFAPQAQVAKKKTIDKITINKKVNKSTKTKKDSSLINYLFVADPKNKYEYSDTSIINFDNYSQLWSPTNPYLYLGNFGSASTSFTYTIPQNISIRDGFDAYDVYRFNIDSIKIFDILQPINDLSFTPQNGQANFLVKTRFARNFSDGISLHINYNRIKQEGFYLNQDTKSTQLSSSIYYQSPNSKLSSIWTLLINNNSEAHNGGIVSDEQFDSPLFQTRNQIPVNLSNANSRYAHKTYHVSHRYSIVNNDANSLRISLNHAIRYDNKTIRYSDDGVSTDSSYYKQFFVDKRGLRLYFNKKSVENIFSTTINKSKIINVTSGLSYRYSKVLYDPDSQSLHEFYLFGKLKSNYKSIKINGLFEAGFGDITGDFNIGGDAQFKSKLLELNGGIRFFRTNPSLKEQKILINEQKIWDNELKKPFGSELNARLTFPSISLTFDIRQIIETNTIYFDSIGNVKQLADVLSISKFRLNHHSSIGSVHLVNNFIVQLNNSKELSIPSYFSNHRLYIQTKGFKGKLENQMGLEFNYIHDFDGRNYIPIIGAFGHTDKRIPSFPKLNLYYNFKIQGFRVFLKYGNLLELFDNQASYHILNYPQFDARFRMGIAWLLYN